MIIMECVNMLSLSYTDNNGICFVNYPHPCSFHIHCVLLMHFIYLAVPVESDITLGVTTLLHCTKKGSNQTHE